MGYSGITSLTRMDIVEGDVTMAQIAVFETVDIDGNPVSQATVLELGPVLIVMLRGLF